MNGETECDAVPTADRRWLTASPLILTAAAYGWILGIGFHHDDFIHLYAAANLPTAEFIAHGMGGHALAISNVVFLATLHVFGLAPVFWMGTVLLTHLGNVLLCLTIAHRLTRDLYLSSLAATLWGTSAAVLGTLRWYTAYEEVLATTFDLLALLVVTTLARRRRAATVAELLPACVFAWAGTLCFGTGLAFVLVFPVAAWLMSPRGTIQGASRTLLIATPIIGAAIYLANIGLTEASGTLTHPPGAMQNTVIPFFADDWGHKIAAVALLFVEGLGSLVANLSASPLRALGVVLLLGAVAATSRVREDARRSALALTLFGLSAYVVIAAARGMLAVATPLPFSHYHYQPTAYLVLALATIAAPVLAGPAWFVWRRRVAAAATGLAAVAVLMRGWPAEPLEGATAADFDEFRASILGAADTQTQHGVVYVSNGPYPPAGELLGGPVSHLFPGLAGVYCITFGAPDAAGAVVRFVEPDARIRAAAAGGTCSHDLFVARLPDSDVHPR
jgi:hypothetical protein